MKIKKSIAVVLCLIISLLITGCSANKPTTDISSAPEAAAQALGEGATQFYLTVTDKSGEKSRLSINTDRKTVGDALLDLEVIDGEQGDYGLYIKSVQGESLDFETDGRYWAFYENGKYATAGVSETEIKAGTEYALKAE